MKYHTQLYSIPDGVGDGVAAARPPTGDGVKPVLPWPWPWPWPGNDAPSEFTGEGRGGGGRLGRADGRGGFGFWYICNYNNNILFEIS